MQRRRRNIAKIQGVGGFFSPYIKHMCAVGAAIMLSSSSILLISKVIRHTVDYGFAKNDLQMINKSCLLMIFLVLLLTAGSIIRLFFINFIGDRAIADLRRAIYKSIINISIAKFESSRHGALLALLISDTAAMHTIIISSVSSVLRNIILTLGSIAMMFATSFKLSLMTLLFLPLMVTPIMIIGNLARRGARASRDLTDEIFSEAESSLSNIHLIQSYTRESLSEEKFTAIIERQIKAARKHSLIRACLVATVMTLGFSGIILLLWLSGREVIAGRLSAGDISSFLLLLVICGAAFGAIADSAQDIGKFFGLCQKISAFLAENPLPSGEVAREVLVESALKSESQSSGPANVFANHQGIDPLLQGPMTLSIRQLSFAYPHKKNLALDDISIDLHAGHVTALVGSSGAGKSTIIKLLLRFYETAGEGSIFCNGIDIRTIHLPNLRQYFAYVSQDSYIFPDSIYANIAYGNPDATREQIEEAAHQAAAFEFIGKLPEGFETFVGERGLLLSGGQKQRICIARAIVRNPRILLLDEATSALDSYNERKIHGALSHLMKDRTTLVIAHRMSTVMNADHIVVLKRGKVVQEGKHDELIQDQSSEYYRLLHVRSLYESQIRDGAGEEAEDLIPGEQNCAN